MAQALAHLLPYLRRLTRPAGADAELLERFVRQRDETAFAALVARHGPMVVHVCRRVLGDSDAVEDAFQAVFLVLARRAAALGGVPSLAGWLHGVAQRVALKARGSRFRAPSAQSLTAVADPVDSRADPLSILSARELLVVLEEEVGHLPEAYRLAVVWCCFEGLSLEEAARQLGRTTGALRGHLERGRKRLHARLTRRGVTLSAALAAAEAARQAANAGVPPLLAERTVQAALQSLAKTAPAGAVSATALFLAEGVVTNMWMLKPVSVLVFSLSLLAAGALAGVLLGQAGPGNPPGQSGIVAADLTATPSPDPTPAKPNSAAIEQERNRFIGSWQLVGGEAEGKKYSRREVDDELRAKIYHIADLEGRKRPAGLFGVMPPPVGYFIVFDSEGNWKQHMEGDPKFTYADCAGSSVLDPAKDPRTIDFTVTRSYNLHAVENKSEKKGRVKAGIYEFVDDNTCRICLPSGPGQKRPASFATKLGSEYAVSIFQRVKKDDEKAVRRDPWKVRLASGLTVELAGIWQHPSKPGSWWRPDGSPLAKAPYDEFSGSVYPSPKEQAREFAIRVLDVPADHSARWEVRPEGSMVSTSVQKDGKRVADVLAAAVIIPAAERTCSVRFGVAAGPWTTAQRSKGNSSIGGKDLSVIFGTPRQVKEQTAISVSYSHGPWDVRLVLVDTDGTTHRAGSVQSGSSGPICQIDALFDIKKERLREFRFQTRPFDWAEFKDVPLSPGPNERSAWMMFVEPDKVSFGIVPQGHSATKAIDVTYAGPLDWRLTEIVKKRSVPFNITVEQMHRTLPTRSGNGKAVYRLTITLKADAPAGPFRQEIILKTNDPANPNAIVPVEGTIQAPGDAAKTAAARDLKLLQGSWKAVTVQVNGKEDETDQARLIFKEDRCSFGRKGRIDKVMICRPSPSSTPKEIDFVEDAAGGRTMPGIYQLQGDNLKICFAERGTQRPTEFTTRRGSNMVLLTLKRE